MRGFSDFAVRLRNGRSGILQRDRRNVWLTPSIAERNGKLRYGRRFGAHSANFRESALPNLSQVTLEPARMAFFSIGQRVAH